MLIIPELETVVLQPPRTASTSLRAAVLEAYPMAFTPYRHMERDGIPFGYENFRVVGIVRHPVRRLLSLYRYMRNFSSPSGETSAAIAAAYAADTDRPFPEWLAHGTHHFCTPRLPGEAFCPRYAVKHPDPIARRSQVEWIRPDMGEVEILPVERLACVEDRLGVCLPHMNAARAPVPTVDAAAWAVISKFHAWDLEIYDLMDL